MQRVLTRGLFAVWIGMAGAEAHAAQPQATAEPASASYQAIRAALQLRDVPLRAHPTCRNAAPVLPARSIGDYLAGFLANMDKGRNTVTAACQPRGAGQRCELWLKHADEEDEWGWGIGFDVDRGGQARKGTVRCLGSG
jgi:hypothetical protein